jgi:hypothetical protein
MKPLEPLWARIEEHGTPSKWRQVIPMAGGNFRDGPKSGVAYEANCDPSHPGAIVTLLADGKGGWVYQNTLIPV